jgi:hypothetical protein
MPPLDNPKQEPALSCPANDNYVPMFPNSPRICEFERMFLAAYLEAKSETPESS